MMKTKELRIEKLIFEVEVEFMVELDAPLLLAWFSLLPIVVSRL